MNIQDVTSGQSKTLIRGYSDCRSHEAVLDKFKHEELKSNQDKLQVHCIGGGKITHINNH